MILGCATSRGYLVRDGSGYRDFYGPKAICECRTGGFGRPHAKVQPSGEAAANFARARHTALVSVTEALVQDLRNQLLRYRCKNLVRAHTFHFDASLLSADTRAIANALGACIIESPELQSQLVSLLTPAENQRKADQSTGLEAMTLEATLNPGRCRQNSGPG